jgi:hypothetical protein
VCKFWRRERRYWRLRAVASARDMLVVLSKKARTEAIAASEGDA